MTANMLTPEYFNQHTKDHLPDHLGIVVTHVAPSEVRCQFRITQAIMAPNGFLHAGSVVTLADTAAGLGCHAHLPEGASGYTTIELKSNFMGTAREGMVSCIATPAHLGKSTQVWDSVVTHDDTGKTIALFRCTQMILYPKAGGAK